MLSTYPPLRLLNDTLTSRREVTYSLRANQEVLTVTSPQRKRGGVRILLFPSVFMFVSACS